MNVYGELVDLVCTMENGKQVRFENFEKSDKVVYVRNNDHSEPDTRIAFTSYLFTEIDKSITSLTISARETNLIKVENKAQFEALLQVIEKAKLGQPYIISSQALNSIETENALQVFPLNDASTCDKIQYLCRAYDDIQKRFFEHYGLEVCATTKLAQQTAEESKQGCNARKVVPYAKMKTRKQAIEEINAKFGLTASVKFSDAWYEEIVKEVNEGGVEDELKEDTGKSDDNGTVNDDK